MTVDNDDGFMLTGDAAGGAEATAIMPDGWDDDPAKQGAKKGEEALYLELDGWEGPLDLLLDLARRQKVELRALSILALVDQ